MELQEFLTFLDKCGGHLQLTEMNAVAAREAERAGLVTIAPRSIPLGRGQISRQFVRVVYDIDKVKGA